MSGPRSYANFPCALLTPNPDGVNAPSNMKRWSGGKVDPERFGVEKTVKAAERPSQETL